MSSEFLKFFLIFLLYYLIFGYEESKNNIIIILRLFMNYQLTYQMIKDAIYKFEL